MSNQPLTYADRTIEGLITAASPLLEISSARRFGIQAGYTNLDHLLGHIFELGVLRLGRSIDFLRLSCFYSQLSHDRIGMLHSEYKEKAAGALARARQLGGFEQAHAALSQDNVVGVRHAMHNLFLLFHPQQRTTEIHHSIDSITYWALEMLEEPVDSKILDDIIFPSVMSASHIRGFSPQAVAYVKAAYAKQRLSGAAGCSSLREDHGSERASIAMHDVMKVVQEVQPEKLRDIYYAGRACELIDPITHEGSSKDFRRSSYLHMRQVFLSPLREATLREAHDVYGSLSIKARRRAAQALYWMALSDSDTQDAQATVAYLADAVDHMSKVCMESDFPPDHHLLGLLCERYSHDIPRGPRRTKLLEAASEAVAYARSLGYASPSTLVQPSTVTESSNALPALTASSGTASSGTLVHLAILESLK